jgi:crotonobetaine/carnitine-CoA ligase
MEGYWNKPEVNARSFSDGWFRTGDIFTRIKGGHFRHVGRFKDMSKRSGENISAVEVDTMMRQFSAIEEVAVIPVKHKVRGEEVKTFITLHPKASVASFDYAALHAHCTERLTSFKIPRYFEIIKAFDHTPSAKIKKNGLITNNSLEENWDYTIGAPVEG